MRRYLAVALSLIIFIEPPCFAAVSVSRTSLGFPSLGQEPVDRAGTRLLPSFSGQKGVREQVSALKGLDGDGSGEWTRVAEAVPPPQGMRRLDREALTEYLNAFRDLRVPLQSLIGARKALRELVQQEQAAWGSILRQLGAPPLQGSIAAEEARLHGITLPALAAITASYEQSLIERLGALEAADGRPAPSGRSEDTLLEASVRVDVVLGPAESYALLERRTVDRLSDLHASLLPGRPYLLVVAAPGSRWSLGDLILQVANTQRAVRRSEAEVEVRRALSEKRLTLTTLKMDLEELKGVEAQEALASRLQSRIPVVAARGPEWKGAAEVLTVLRQIVQMQVERLHGVVGARTDPLWLDQDTTLFLPALQGDPELSNLRSSRERAAQSLLQIVEGRMSALETLETSIRERNTVFRQALLFLAPEEGKEVGSAWQQAKQWLRIEGEHLEWIAALRAVLRQSPSQSHEDRLASKRQAAAISLLGRTIESLLAIEEVLTSLMTDLLDAWQVPSGFMERAAQVQRKVETLIRFTSATRNISSAVQTIRRENGAEEKAFTELQAYMGRLNELRLKRLTEALSKVKGMRPASGRGSFRAKVAAMVTRWLTRERADTEEAITLGDRVRKEGTQNPLLGLQWSSEGRLWADAMQAGPGLALIERQVAMLPRLPVELAQALDQNAPPDAHLGILFRLSDRLNLVKGVSEGPDGVGVLLADGVEEVRVEGIGAGIPRVTGYGGSGPFRLVAAAWSPGDVPFALATDDTYLSPIIVADAGAPDEMGVGEKFVKIGAASAANSAQAIKNNWKSYAVLGGMAALGGLMIATGVGAPIGGALVSAAGKGVLLTAYVDTSVATAKTAVKAVNPEQAEQYQRYIDGVKGAYDIAKFLETLKNIKDLVSQTKEAGGKAADLTGRQAKNIEGQITGTENEMRSLQNARDGLVRGIEEGRFRGSGRIDKLDSQIGRLQEQLAQLQEKLQGAPGGGVSPDAAKLVEALEKLKGKLDAYTVGQITKELEHLLAGSGRSTGEKIVKGIKAVEGAVGDGPKDDQKAKEQEEARRKAEEERKRKEEEEKRKAEEAARRKAALQDALKQVEALVAAARAAAGRTQAALAAAKGASAAGGTATSTANGAQGAAQQAKGAVDAARAACAKVVSEGVIDAARARAEAAAGDVGALYQEVVDLAKQACEAAVQVQKAANADARRILNTKAGALAARAQSRAASAEAALARARAEAAQAARQTAARQVAAQQNETARAALAAARGQVSAAEGAMNVHEATVTSAQGQLDAARTASDEVERNKTAARGVLGPFLSEPEAQMMLPVINGVVAPSVEGVDQPLQQALSAIQQARQTVAKTLEQLGAWEGALTNCGDLASTDGLAEAATAAASAAELFLPRISSAAARAAECAGADPGMGGGPPDTKGATEAGTGFGGGIPSQGPTSGATGGTVMEQPGQKPSPGGAGETGGTGPGTPQGIWCISEKTKEWYMIPYGPCPPPGMAPTGDPSVRVPWQGLVPGSQPPTGGEGKCKPPCHEKPDGSGCHCPSQPCSP